MSSSRLLLALASVVLAACSSAPCSGFCKLDCQVAIKCADGKNPTGAKLTACVDSCVEAVKNAGVTDDKQCECCTPGGLEADGGARTCPAGSISCDQVATAQWAKTYACQ